MSGFRHPREQSLAKVHKPHLPLQGWTYHASLSVFCFQECGVPGLAMKKRGLFWPSFSCRCKVCCPPLIAFLPAESQGSTYREARVCHACVTSGFSLSQPRGGLTPNQIPCSKRNSWLKLLPLLPLAVVDIQHAFLLGRDQIQTTVPPWEPACRRTASTRHCQADGKTLLGRNAL